MELQGYRVWGSGLRFQGLGYGAVMYGCSRVSGLGFGV